MKKYIISFDNYKDRGEQLKWVRNPKLVNFEDGSFGVRIGTWWSGYSFLNEEATVSFVKQGDINTSCSFDLSVAKLAIIKLKQNHIELTKYFDDYIAREKARKVATLVHNNKAITYTMVGTVKDD